MSTFVRVERVELVTDAGPVGFLLRRCGFWWSVVTDTGTVLADTNAEADAQAALDGAVSELEAKGACVRRRWRAAEGVSC